MNHPYLTDREAAALYEHWHERTEQRIRNATAKAHGRRDRHGSDLADLKRDLGSVNLRGLLEPAPEAAPGTPIQAVADAARFLEVAEQHHALGGHKHAIVYLQLAHTAADLAIQLVENASGHPDTDGAHGRILPWQTACAQQSGDGQDPDWPLPIPTQRE